MHFSIPFSLQVHVFSTLIASIASWAKGADSVKETQAYAHADNNRSPLKTFLPFSKSTVVVPKGSNDRGDSILDERGTLKADI
jgi:hypothetical protein